VPSNPVSLREGIERELDRAYARNRWSDDERDDGLISERDLDEWARERNREIREMHERIAHQMAGIPTSSSSDSTTTSSDEEEEQVHTEPEPK
jgi:phage terminase large subunit-like protein